MDCSSITDFQQSTAICIAKKFRNLHIGKLKFLHNFFSTNIIRDIPDKYQVCGGPHTLTKPTQGMPAMSSLMGSPCLINGYEKELLMVCLIFVQGGRTWQPFVGVKNGHAIFVKRVFTIFATNALFLRVIANLQI